MSSVGGVIKAIKNAWRWIYIIFLSLNKYRQCFDVWQPYTTGTGSTYDWFQYSPNEEIFPHMLVNKTTTLSCFDIKIYSVCFVCIKRNWCYIWIILIIYQLLEKRCVLVYYKKSNSLFWRSKIYTILCYEDYSGKNGLENPKIYKRIYVENCL